MTAALQVLEALNAASIHMRVDGQTIFLSPSSRLTPELRELVKQHKQELLSEASSAAGVNKEPIGNHMHSNVAQQEAGLNGASKVDRYKWTMTGRPGRLEWINKRALEVDHLYQRQAKNARVLKLTRRWNWLACGVLIVAYRAGRYFVVDGQHRLMAALKRADIEDLPCLVFDSAELREEAAAFRDVNKERRPITTLEQWNADLVARDADVLFANELIESAGRAAANAASSTSVRCLSSLVNAARSNREALLRAWPVIVELCSGQPLHERVFGSLFYLECNGPEQQSISRKPWRERVLKLGYGGVVTATGRAAAFYAKGGPKVWALGVIEAANKGYRVNLLSLRAEGAGL